MKHLHTRVKSPEIVNDDIMIDVNLRVEACFIRKSASIARWMHKRKEIFDIKEQRIVSNLVSMQIGGRERQKQRQGCKEQANRSCKVFGRTRLEDFSDAEGKTVTANSPLSSTAAVSPLADDHVTTFYCDCVAC